MSQFAKNLLLWIIVAMVLMSIFQHYAETEPPATEMKYSEFLDSVRNGEINSVTLQVTSGGKEITGTTTNGQQFQTFGPPDDSGLIADLENNNVDHETIKPKVARFWLIF